MVAFARARDRRAGNSSSIERGENDGGGGGQRLEQVSVTSCPTCQHSLHRNAAVLIHTSRERTNEATRYDTHAHSQHTLHSGGVTILTHALICLSTLFIHNLKLEHTTIITHIHTPRCPNINSITRSTAVSWLLRVR